MPDNTNSQEPYDNIKAPLYKVVGEVTALWTLASFGYYLILPALGFGLSYNSDSLTMAFYFLFWAVTSIWLFWDIFSKWLEINSRIWLWGALSLGFAGVIWLLLHFLALLPALQGPILAPFTDILFATPKYFLPKAAEILVQQVLITALILSFHFRFHNIKEVMIGYVITFGGAHVLLYILNGAPTAYATLMTIGSVLSTFVFPRIIIKVRGGFLYNYMIHLCFYIFLALILHTWPPPGYWS